MGTVKKVNLRKILLTERNAVLSQKTLPCNRKVRGEFNPQQRSSIASNCDTES